MAISFNVDQLWASLLFLICQLSLFCYITAVLSLSIAITLFDKFIEYIVSTAISFKATALPTLNSCGQLTHTHSTAAASYACSPTCLRCPPLSSIELLLKAVLLFQLFCCAGVSFCCSAALRLQQTRCFLWPHCESSNKQQQ